MNIKNIIVAAFASIALMAAPVMAADLTSPAINPVFVSQVVNFDGAYAGLGVVHSKTTGENVALASIGYDLRSDIFIVGVEGSATIEKTPVLGVDVKAGVAVFDNVAVYGIVGAQRDTGTNVDSHSFGVGADVALSEAVYLTGSYRQVFDFGTSNLTDEQFRVGVKLPF